MSRRSSRTASSCSSRRRSDRLGSLVPQRTRSSTPSTTPLLPTTNNTRCPSPCRDEGSPHGGGLFDHTWSLTLTKHLATSLRCTYTHPPRVNFFDEARLPLSAGHTTCCLTHDDTIGPPARPGPGPSTTPPNQLCLSRHGTNLHPDPTAPRRLLRTIQPYYYYYYY